MDFKKLQAMFPIILIGAFVLWSFVWKVFLKTNSSASENRCSSKSNCEFTKQINSS